MAKAAVKYTNGSNTNGSKPSYLDNTDQPDEVLAYWQTYYHKEAKELKQLLIDKLKADDVANPNELRTLLVHFGDYRQAAVDVAAKRINYHQPKLANIDVQQETTHRFVIQGPKPVSAEEWLRLTGATRLDPAAERPTDNSTAIPRMRLPYVTEIEDGEDDDEARM